MYEPGANTSAGNEDARQSDSRSWADLLKPVALFPGLGSTARRVPGGSVLPDIAAYYAQHKISPRYVFRLLRNIERQGRSEEVDKNIREAIAGAIKRHECLEPTLESVIDLARILRGAPKHLEILSPKAIAHYTHTREVLARLEGSYNGPMYRTFCAGTRAIFSGLAPQHGLYLYCELFPIACQKEQDLGAFQTGCKHIGEVSRSPRETRVVLSAAASHIVSRSSFSSFAESAAELLLRLRNCAPEERQRILPMLEEGFPLPIRHGFRSDGLLGGISALIEEEVPSNVVQLFCRVAMLFAREREDAHTGLVTSLCLGLGDYKISEPHRKALLDSTNPAGYSIRAAQALSQLQDLASHAAATELLVTELPERRKAISRDIADFSARYPQEVPHALVPQSGEVSGRNLYFFSRLSDLHHGFGAYAFLARRPPSGEAPLLARFGGAVGRCSYVNAKSIDQFPGRGVVISGISPEKIFAPEYDRTGKATFRHYRDAWPGLAGEITDMSSAAFVFTRGMIAVIPPRLGKYCINPYPGTSDPALHYALLICNDHFENPDSSVAILIPSALLASRLKGCLVPYEDFTGFSGVHRDINRTGLSLQALRKEAGLSCFEVGRASAILRGYDDSGVPSARRDYQERREEFESLVRRTAGRGDSFRTPANISMLYMDRREQAEALELYREVELLDRRVRQELVDGRRFNGKISSVLEASINLLDLFRLGQALWHKGQTAQEVQTEQDFTRPGPSNEGEAPVVGTASIKDLTAIQFDREDAVFNPEATRMLREAYAWHSQRRHGVEDAARFPIFASASTLEASAAPNGKVSLDSFTMELRVGSLSIALPTESDGSGLDEGIVWVTKVLPILNRSLEDIRPYHREGIKPINRS